MILSPSKSYLRSKQFFLGMLAIVTVSVAVFASINTLGEALAVQGSASSLPSLPSHFRWGTTQTVSPSAYCEVRNRVGNLSGIARAELRSEAIATTTDTPGTREVDVFAVSNESKVYSGLTYVSGHRTPGPGEVIVVRNSSNSSLFELGQVVRANFFPFPVSQPKTERNLTIAGFADLTVDGFGFLTNSETTGPITANLISFPTFIADWDSLIPSLIDFGNTNNLEPFLTQIFAYANQSNFINSNVEGQFVWVQTLRGQIQSSASQYGGTADSWLTNQIADENYQVQLYRVFSIAVALITLTLSIPIAKKLTNHSMKPSSNEEESKWIASDDSLSGPWPIGVDSFLAGAFIAGLVGIIVGVSVSVVVTLSWTMSVALSVPIYTTLVFSTIFGSVLTVFVSLKVWETMKGSTVTTGTCRRLLDAPSDSSPS